MFSELTPAWNEIIIPILPEIGLLALLLIILLVDLGSRPVRRKTAGIVAAAGMLVILAINMVVSFSAMGVTAFAGQDVLGGMIGYDLLATMFRTMVLTAGFLTCLITLDVEGLGRQGEFYAILTVATLGMSLMSAARDLIMVFVALETTSISLYVLAGFLRDSRQSAEAGMKYYLFGAFTSAILLYGLSLLFGFSGTTDVGAMAEPIRALITSGDPASIFGFVLALLLVLMGFAFKVAAVPFHFWTPDVYQGAPTPVTAFVSTASKAASFALLMRLFLAIWPVEAVPYWTGIVAVIAVVTMFTGNLLALAQSNIKRMLAYSSIAQAGYALVGVVAISENTLGVAAVAFYMFMYVFTNILAFTIVIVVSNVTGGDDIKDFANLGRRAPYLALAMTVALLSLAGIPPAAGFFGKFFLFAAAIEAGYIWLAMIGFINAIVALYYYLTVVKVMFVDTSEDTSRITAAPSYSIAVAITVIGVLLMGIFASPWWVWAQDAANTIAGMVN